MPSILKKTTAFQWLLLSFLLAPVLVPAQAKLSIDKVYRAYIRNSGTIIEKGQIKGYYFLYQSDKIDRHTDEYTLQILDENLNKVKSIKFEDTKKLSLLEASYNGSSLAFLFKNDDDKTLDMKIYDFDGKLKYSYSTAFDKRTDDLMKQYATLHTDEGMNKNVFDVGEQGYVSVMPLRDGKQRTYEVDYYSSESRKQWTYEPTDDAEKYASAEYLGATDSLIILEVMKRSHTFSQNVTSHLVGINFVTHKKQFELEQNENDDTKLLPSYVAPVEGTNNLLVVGSYYDKDQNIMKDYGRGIGFYMITPSGKLLGKALNTWAGDFGRYLATNSKGKIDDIGYLYIHKVIETPDHKLFVVAEGYKRTVSAAGIAFNVLTQSTNFANTKMTVTDMVVMEFNNHLKVVNATIYDKRDHGAATPGNSADYNSQHMLAKFLDMMGEFDYAFTTGDADNSNFTVCYGDYERSSEYHGETFNAIHYNGSKLSTDKIELKSKASTLRVFPAKSGSVMILEYYKKDKRLDFRLEKLG